MQSTSREAQKPHRQETSATELNGHPLKRDHRTYTCTSTRKTMSGCDVTMIFISIHIEGNYLEWRV